MARSKKNAEKVTDEIKNNNEINENPVDGENTVKLLAPEIEPVIPIEEVESPVFDDDDELDGEIMEDFEVDEKPIVEPKTRTIESLSHKEFRIFQRTGQMPK